MTVQADQNETGVTDPVAEDNDAFQQIPEDQLIDATEADSRDADVVSDDVPNPQAENFRALRKEIEEKVSRIDELEKTRQSEHQAYQSQLEDVQRSLRSQNQPKEDRLFGDYDDEYVPSVGELRSVFQKQEAGMREQMEELQIMQKHPDYQDVLKDHFLPLVKDKPHLVQMVQNSTNKAQAAYELGRMAMGMQKSTPEMSGAEKAQRIVSNARKPGNVATVGGSSVINKADYYAQMSDSDFAKLAAKNLGEI